MSLSPLESPLWRGLYGSPLTEQMLGDGPLIDAMIRVESALAGACADAGLVPRDEADRLCDALAGMTLAPEDLAEGAARDGVPIPALLAALRARLDPELAEWLHWGATSQDICDTATVLALRAFGTALADEIAALLDRLGVLAADEAETVQLARTRTQGAMPTTFGATVATWGHALAESGAGLADAMTRLSTLSLHGAAGTDAALGERAPALRAALARRLELRAEDTPWHTSRGRMSAVASALGALAASAGKIGGDLAFLGSTGIEEIRLAGGGSSAMPHKVNPVRAEAAQSLARMAAHYQAAVTEAAIHTANRDGAAWGLEWLSLRPLCACAAAAVDNVAQAVAGMEPRRDAMEANLAALGAAAYSERLAYTLAQHMPRSAARRAVTEALATEHPRAALRAACPAADLDTAFDPLAAAGAAPAQARAFAASRTPRR